jgi:translation initiation factor IF-3
MKENHISEPRINDRIRVPEVRLVGPNGEQVGIVRVEDALRLAQEADLDLVEVAPQARPPVCKLMDFGKFKYESAIKDREARKNQAHTVLKEIRLRLKIDPHDYGTKKGHVERFLKAGDKVKVMIMFRGREQSRPEMGYRLLQRMAADVAELGYVESTPKQDGRNMIMVIGPLKKKADTKVEKAPRAPRRRDDEDSLDQSATLDDEATADLDRSARPVPAAVPAGAALAGTVSAGTTATSTASSGPASTDADENPIFVKRATPPPSAAPATSSGPSSYSRPPSSSRPASTSRPPSSAPSSRPPSTGRPAPASAPAGRPASAPSGRPAPAPAGRPAAAARPTPSVRPTPSPGPAGPTGTPGPSPRPGPTARPTPGSMPKPGPAPRPGPSPTPGPSPSPKPKDEAAPAAKSEQAAADA